MSLLELENLSLGYGKKTVLDRVSLRLETGEIVGVIGPNGCGKSTLVKGSCRIVTPRSGRILLKGQDISTMSRSSLARIMAIVPQHPVLPEAFLAAEVVMMGRTPHLGFFGQENRKDAEVVCWAMERTGTMHLTDKKIGELSGGERQRLTIARAFAQEPEVLLLDEPTVHLDINYQIEVLELMREMAQEKGIGVLVVLHDLNLAAQYCDRLVMLEGGRIFAEGSPARVITPDNIRVVYGAEIYVYPHPINRLPATLLMPKGHTRTKSEGEKGVNQA